MSTGKIVGITIGSTVLGFAIFAGCLAAIGSSTSSDDTSSSAESSPVEIKTDPTPETNSKLDPVEKDYEDIIVGPITNTEICESYSAIIDKYLPVASKRKESLSGKQKDPYKAEKFVKNNKWIFGDLVTDFESEFEDAAKTALNSLTDGQVEAVRNPKSYLRDSLQECGLSEAHESLSQDISTVNRLEENVIAAAANKPWYPKGFRSYSSDLAYKWVDKAGPPPTCFGCSYWTMDVISKNGCPRSLYGEISIERNGTAIDWTNDTLSSLRPKQKGRLQFTTYNDSAQSASLSKLSCY